MTSPTLTAGPSLSTTVVWPASSTSYMTLLDGTTQLAVLRIASGSTILVPPDFKDLNWGGNATSLIPASPTNEALQQAVWVSVDNGGTNLAFHRLLSSSTSVSASTTSIPASTTSVETSSTPGTTITPSSPAPTFTKVPIEHSDGVSTGAAAGIAVGCLFAGAIIAALILWLCWGRKRSTKSKYSQPETYAPASEEKGFSTRSTPLVDRSNTETSLLGILPQPLEDKAISGDVSKISNAIKNHVQSYYHTNRISSNSADRSDLHTLGLNLPISAGTLNALMSDTRTREVALRFIIAWVIVSRLQPSKDSTKSLLPAEIAQCLQIIDSGNHEQQTQYSKLARWRVMTADLMQSSYVRNPFTSSDSRHKIIQATLVTLESILEPYGDSRMNNGDRKRNLEELLKRSALFAFTLFSQPVAWEFEWQEHNATSGELCIFPALVQVVDESGRLVNPPRPFSEAVVRHLDV